MTKTKTRRVGMANFRLKQAIKQAKIPVIIGAALFGVGAIILIIAFACQVDALMWIGFILVGGGILSIVIGVMLAKDTMIAICPECQKYMGDTNQPVKYEFTLAQTEKNFDSMGKYANTTFSYDCSITCPHCGNTTMFVHKIRDEDASKAHVRMDKFLKSTLKMTEKK